MWTDVKHLGFVTGESYILLGPDNFAPSRSFFIGAGVSGVDPLTNVQIGLLYIVMNPWNPGSPSGEKKI
jgi:hypothetical protein